MRTEQELQDNKARYWRQLNAACGVPAGTHPDDPNPAGSDDPRRDPRAYARPAASYAPAVAFPGYGEVHQALIKDPEVVEFFRDHWDDNFQPHDFGPMPHDAFGQLRWYILRDLNEFHHKRHKADFEDAKKHRVAKRVAALFENLSRRDPLFTGTLQVMQQYMGTLPASLRKAVDESFTRCPVEVLDFYREMRAVAGEVAKRYHGRNTGRQTS